MRLFRIFTHCVTIKLFWEQFKINFFQAAPTLTRLVIIECIHKSGEKKLKRIDQNEKSLHRGASLELEKCRLILHPLKFFFCQLPISSQVIQNSNDQANCSSELQKFDRKKQILCLRERSELRLQFRRENCYCFESSKFLILSFSAVCLQ